MTSLRKSSGPPKQALIVAGMHRSGTSAVTRVLNLLGADLPTRLMPAVPGDNDLGFWESLDIVEIHEKLLSSAHSSWDAVGPLDDTWFQSDSAVRAEKELLQVLARDFSSSELFVIKDPRICRLVPLWKSLLKQFGARPYFVIPLRNPLEVAESLRRRNRFALEKSLLVWLWHVLEVERATRRSMRSFVSYAELLRNWRGAVETLETDFGISFPNGMEAAADIDTFISERYHRISLPTEDLRSRPEVTAWVARAFAALGAYRDSPALCARRLDRIRRELLLAHSAYGPVLDGLAADLGDTRSELNELARTIGSREEDLSKERARSAELTGMLDERQVELDRLGSARGALEARLARTSKRSGELSGLLKERQEGHDHLLAAVNDRESRLARLRERAAELSGQLSALQAELDRLNSMVAQRDDNMARADVRAARLAWQIEERQGDLLRLEATLRRKDTELDRLNSVVAQRDDNMARADVRAARLAGQLEERQGDLLRLEATLRRKDTELAEAGVRARDLARELASLQAQVRDLGSGLHDRDASLARAHEQAGRLAQELTKHELEVDGLSNRLASLEAVREQQATTIKDVLSSWSWAVTRPGRRLSAFLSGVVRAMPKPSRGRSRILQQAVLFDTDYFRDQLPARLRKRRDPLRLYLEGQTALEASPHPLFDTSYYLGRNPEVIQRGLNPLLHFLDSGWRDAASPHPLFAIDFYRHQMADLEPTAQISPLTHYLEHGALEGLDPHPLFDTSYYADEACAGVFEHGFNPLVHFLIFGSEEPLRNPHPLFDSAFYAAQHPEAVENGFNLLLHYLDHASALGSNPHPLFDNAFYRQQISQSDLPPDTDPLAHYLETGAARGLDPHPLFDTSYYLESCPALARTGENPLVHYLRAGALEGLDPHPLFDTSYYADEACPGVFEHGFNPLVHFLVFGAEEPLRNPHPLFDTAFYVEQHPEAIDNGVNPLLHYLNHGSVVGNPHPLFDKAFYRRQVPQTDLPSDADPLAHYLETGAARGLDPHPLFDTSYYLESCPALARAGENPLVHYLRAGALEGLDPHPLFDASYYAHEACPEGFEHGFNPLVHFLVVGADELRNPHPMFDTEFYVAQHPEAVENGLNPLLHYLEHTGEPALRAHRAFDLDFFFEATPANGWLPRDPATESLLRLVETKEIAFVARRSPQLSVVIPVHDQLLFTLQCLHSLSSQQEEVDFEVIVVDDGSRDPGADVLPAIPNLRFLRHESARGFIEAANLGASKARGSHLVFLNNDTVVPPGSLQAMLATFGRFPDAGAVGAKLLFGNGTLQEAGAIVWRDGSAWNYGRNQDPTEPRFNYVRKVDYCSASCLMIPRELFERIGAFDRHFRPMYYEDVDLAFRVRDAGKEVYYQPAAEVFHFEGATSGNDPSSGMKTWQVKNQRKFVERWKEALTAHPPNAHRPNLSKDRGVSKRVLVIDHRLPAADQDAGSVRMIQVLRILRELGFKVTFIPQNLQRTDPYCRRLQDEGVEVLHAPFLTSIREHLESFGALYDVVLLSRISVANEFLAMVRAECPEAQVIFDTVDLHYLRLIREAEFTGDSELLKKARITKHHEMSIALQADSTLVVSPAERDLLLKEDPTLQVDLVPLIHSPVDRVAPFSKRENFYFIGGFEHPPNVDAAIWLVEEILPLIRAEIPDIHLFIVGSKAPASVSRLASEHVTVTGFAKNLEPFLNGCRLSVAPMRFGAGIKGKVTQSLAHGLPCVLTSIAAEGIGLNNGSSAVIADSKEDFARGVIRVYRDEKLWTHLSAAGRETVRRHFSYALARRRLESVLARAQGADATTRRPGKSLQPV